MNAIEEGGVFHECHVKNSQRWLVSQMGRDLLVLLVGVTRGLRGPI